MFSAMINSNQIIEKMHSLARRRLFGAVTVGRARLVHRFPLLCHCIVVRLVRVTLIVCCIGIHGIRAG